MLMGGGGGDASFSGKAVYFFCAKPDGQFQRYKTKEGCNNGSKATVDGKQKR